MQHKIVLVAVGMVLCGLFCGSRLSGQTGSDVTGNTASVPARADPTATGGGLSATRSQYRIGESDILAINVWHEQEVSRVVPVRPDGKISLPLIGEMQATGLTPEALEANITRALKQFIENPGVTVIVQEARSKRISVLGQVNKPGSYILGQPLTVLDALALAGGFKDFAKLKSVYVLRTERTGAKRLPFNYKEVIKGKNVAQNIQLQPGDTVIVP